MLSTSRMPPCQIFCGSCCQIFVTGPFCHLRYLPIVCRRVQLGAQHHAQDRHTRWELPAESGRAQIRAPDQSLLHAHRFRARRPPLDPQRKLCSRQGNQECKSMRLSMLAFRRMSLDEVCRYVEDRKSPRSYSQICKLRTLWSMKLRKLIC